MSDELKSEQVSTVLSRSGRSHNFWWPRDVLAAYSDRFHTHEGGCAVCAMPHGVCKCLPNGWRAMGLQALLAAVTHNGAGAWLRRYVVRDMQATTSTIVRASDGSTGFVSLNAELLSEAFPLRFETADGNCVMCGRHGPITKRPCKCPACRCTRDDWTLTDAATFMHTHVDQHADWLLHVFGREDITNTPRSSPVPRRNPRRRTRGEEAYQNDGQWLVPLKRMRTKQ